MLVLVDTVDGREQPSLAPLEHSRKIASYFRWARINPGRAWPVQSRRGQQETPLHPINHHSDHIYSDPRLVK